MSEAGRIEQAELDRLREYCDIVAVAEELGAVELRREGRRYRGCCMWHEERTGSMVLYPDQATYHCFGCGVCGDVIAMVVEQGGMDFLDAVRWLADRTGYWPEGLAGHDGVVRARQAPAAKPRPRLKQDRRLKWRSITPVPTKVPPIRVGTFESYLHSAKAQIEPSRWWEYRDAAGQLLGCDVRYDYLKRPKDDRYREGDQVEYDGRRDTVTAVHEDCIVLAEAGSLPLAALDRIRLVGKSVITWTWCRHLEEGHEQWRMRAWDDPSPLYGLDRLAARPDAMVIIAEGCKAADAAEQVFDGVVGVSWRGGSDTVTNYERTDWSPLAGRRVVIWPDADGPGIRAAWWLAQHCRRAGVASVRVVPVELVALTKGWDLADPWPEGAADV